MKDTAATVMERCELLANISDEPGLLVRPYGSQAMRRVNDVVARWMREAGMSVRTDAFGNLVGRYAGRDEGAGSFVLGSHLDTVRDAGRYDGTLGVMVALACVEHLHERGEHLPFAVEVVGFADKQGLRFGATHLGSSVFAGVFDGELLGRKDPYGITVAEAVCSFGGDPNALVEDGSGSGDLVGYCEVHIEQGSVLEGLGLPVGAVSGIVGRSNVKIGFSCEAGHAGSFPMEGRRDAVSSAAEFVLAAEETARKEAGMVATVGYVSVPSSAYDAIAGEAHLGLDLRHEDDGARVRALGLLRERAGEIAARRGARCSWHVQQESRAAPTDPELTELLARAVEDLGYPAQRLPSGAVHDAAVLAEIAPISMLFVRCRGGASQGPAESVEPEDVAVAIEATSRFLALLAQEAPQR